MKGSKRLLRGRGKNAVWELRVSTGKDAVSGKYGQTSRIWPGYAGDDPEITTAAQALAKLIRETEATRAIGATGPAGTVEQLLAKWLKHIASEGRSPTTLREYKRLIEKRIKPGVGSIPLKKLSTLDLDTYYAGLTSEGLSPSTVRQCHSILRAACKQAVRWRMLASNPAAEASPAKLVQKEIVAPSVSDVQKMIAAADANDPDMAAYIAIAAVTGARRGELCGLRWGDIDWKAMTLTIERSVASMGRGKLITKSTKTHGVRRLALDEFGETVLKRHLVEAESRSRDLGIEISSETPIFTYDGRRPIAPDTASHYVTKIADDVGVKTHLHALRHFAATQLIGAGHDVMTVAGRLGHKDPSVTLNVYASALPERDRDAANFLGGALTPARASVP
jgi:integrase